MAARGSAAGRVPAWIEPMLATPDGGRLVADPAWAYEYKLDGYRACLRIASDGTTPMPDPYRVSVVRAFTFTELDADRRTPADLLDHAAASGYEGLVAKLRTGTYQPGPAQRRVAQAPADPHHRSHHLRLPAPARAASPAGWAGSPSAPTTRTPATWFTSATSAC
ncbi:hypothetical protein [Amycolatopsis sp. NBC_00438]|uniref:hypothetical protein n=1 Tax=Amycolatopsis sp. NBC_00438 TaxID=2903558 RepID=UPI002E1F6C04